MFSPEIRKNALSVGILLLPLVLVKVAGVIFGGPAGARAETATPVLTPETPAVAPTAAAVKLTKQQLEASNYIQSLRSLPFGQSPLLYQKVAAPPVAPVPEVPVVTETPTAHAIPKFVLNAIMTGASGRKALINNRPYVEGDKIRGTEWSLTTIDAPGRAITLTESSTGETLTIRVNVK